MLGLFISIYPHFLKNFSSYLKVFLAKKKLHLFFKEELDKTNIHTLEIYCEDKELFLKNINNVLVNIKLRDCAESNTNTVKSHFINNNRFESTYLDSVLIEANIKIKDLDFFQAKNLHHLKFLINTPKSGVFMTKEKFILKFSLIDTLRQHYTYNQFYSITLAVVLFCLWSMK